MATREEVEQGYQTLFGRGGDQEGINFWADSGMSGGELTTAMADAAQKQSGYTWDKSKGLYTDPNTQKTPSLDDVTPYEPATIPAFSLAKPDSIAAPYKAPIYNAPTYDPDPAKLASGQMDMLMDQNNPYLQQARSAGERTAQARGLLNSSMAASASQGAAIDRALPIAQANAAAYQEAGITGYKSQLDAALQSMNAEIQYNLANQTMVNQDYLNNRSSTLQAMLSSGLSEQEANANLTALEYQGLITAGLNDTEAQNKLKQIEAQTKADLTLDWQQQEGANYRAELETSMNLDKLASSDRESASTQMTNYGIKYQEAVSAIQQNDDLNQTGKAAALLSVQSTYESNMNNLAQLFDIEMAWDLPEINQTTPEDANTDNFAAPNNPMQDNWRVQNYDF